MSISLQDELQRLTDSVACLKTFLGDGPQPSLAMVLGSGLGSFVDQLEDSRAMPYEDIPGFPSSTVKGHAGRLVVGQLHAQTVLILQGRFHVYEGHSARQVAFPIRALVQAGIETFIITNAAGGLGDGFQAGDLMLITDHLNLSGHNPLVGPHHESYGERFPDMTDAYSPALQTIARESAKSLEIDLKHGVYAVLGGPSYETPAEVRTLKTQGADAVGMSTVFEVIVARQMGAKILGISLISNLAAGISPTPLSHAEVVEAGQMAAGSFTKLLRKIIKDM